MAPLSLKDLYANPGLTWQNRILPNGGGTYPSQTTSLAPGGGGNNSVFRGVPPAAPQGGGFLTPEETVNNIVRSLPKSSGDIPTYQGNVLAHGTRPSTSEDLSTTAMGLNNSRNDIASGAYDPYKVASQSGVPYSPAELNAIEKAYAGIYDPAISSAISKLDAQQKRDDIKTKFQYDLALEQAKAGLKGNTGGAKLTTGQKNDVADMLVLQQQISSLKGLKDKYGGYVGAAGAGGGSIQKFIQSATGVGQKGGQDIRNDIGQIKGFIAKLRGGTSFTPNEQALLDTYTPGINDSDSVIESKLNSLDKFINNKIEATFLVSGGEYDPNTLKLSNKGNEPTTNTTDHSHSGSTIEYPKGSGKHYIVDANGEMTPQ